MSHEQVTSFNLLNYVHQFSVVVTSYDTDAKNNNFSFTQMQGLSICIIWEYTDNMWILYGGFCDYLFCHIGGLWQCMRGQLYFELSVGEAAEAVSSFGMEYELLLGWFLIEMICEERDIGARCTHWYFLMHMILLNLLTLRSAGGNRTRQLQCSRESILLPSARTSVDGSLAATIIYSLDELVHCGRVPK
ncbi:unnamed protein product [Prorocentrum cordatum]|uniref:Uncharacterized protein n=1 Tax=Prorocentrum cordatum TaxID=2364126 RepID=A0ABN9UQP9_9DINO|nr:unnamed protein product [Polarella glacialis]